MSNEISRDENESLEIKARFQQISPAAFRAEVPLGWFVLSSNYLANKANRRKAHGMWFRITADRKSAFRVLRFSPNLKGKKETDGEIVIDWAAWLRLNDYADDVASSLYLNITPVARWQTPWMAIKHPDPGIRSSGWLAILSVALGILALMFSVLPLLR